MEENKVAETTIEETKVQAEEIDTPSEEVVAEENTEKEQLKSKKKIWLIVLGAVAILLISAFIFVYAFFLKGNVIKEDTIFYIKDEEIYYTDLYDDEKIELTTQLIDNIYDQDLEEFGYDVPPTIEEYSLLFGDYFNKETKQLFYPDKLNTDDDGINIYYKVLGTEDEVIKIDSDITSGIISPVWDGAIYLKGDNDDLYYHDLKEKTKIATDVEDFYFSNDGQKVLYSTYDGDCYIWYVDESIGKNKVAGSIYSIEYVADDLSTIYYMSDKDYDLIKYVTETEEKTKIAERISYVKKIYDTGEVYYTKSEEVKIPLWDYIDDDWAETDANISKPVYPSMPSSPDLDNYRTRNNNGWYSYYTYNWDSYYAAQDRWEEKCDQLRDNYYNALDDYNNKSSRDELREEIKNYEYTKRIYSLYYYDGSEEKLVSENYAYDEAYLDNRPMAFYSVFGKVEKASLKFSEVYDSGIGAFSAELKYDNALADTIKYWIASKDESIEFESTNPSNFIVSEDESAVYFADNRIDAENYVDIRYELYKIDVTSDDVDSPELYDSDVTIPFDLGTTENGDVIYFKNSFVESEEYEDAPYYAYIEGGDIFFNGKELDYDVTSRRSYDSENNAGPKYINGVLYYLCDWNFDKQNGTLKMYKNGQKIKIADEVHDFSVTDVGNILYLDDYSTESYRGTLKLYKEDEVVKIDDDVNFLIK